ncbi:MAG: hypothetical protein AVDCRST_MAG12-2666, partial [uncultured Rubrobacteraceae bacterium]
GATRLFGTDGIRGHRARLRAAARRVLRLQDHGGRARGLADDPARDHTQRPRQLPPPAGPAAGVGHAGRDRGAGRDALDLRPGGR